MRNRFVDHLMKKVEGGEADRLVVLTGDLGFSVLEPLQEALGPRFINSGVAEALMTSTAAGIASEGYKAFIYSITPFATFRCLEQIRNDICYHKADVTVVGVGAGYGYGPLGPTHHAVEDLACMWALPNMRVYSPADVNQCDWAYEDNWKRGGPSYLRIGKGGEGVLAALPQPKAQSVFEYANGSDVSLVCTGHILEEVLAAQKEFEKRGIRAQVLSVPCVKPFPATELTGAISSDRIVAVEELNPYGGFSGQLSKALLESGKRVSSFRSVSVDDEFAKVVGSMKFQRKQNGLDALSLLSVIESVLS